MTSHKLVEWEQWKELNNYLGEKGSSEIFVRSLFFELTCSTRSSVAADGPRDALCQSKSCHRLHNGRNKLYNKSQTRNSAIAEGPRDASCQLKSCQLPRNNAQTTCTKLKGYSGKMCNKHVYSTITRSSRFHCPIGVINKPTTGVLGDDLLWRNFLSPQCRNCSRDPDHAHLRNTHSSQD